MNFAGLTPEFSSKENAKVWLQSIPYDATSSWGKGADNGFSAFVEASQHLELYDIETQSQVYKYGIHVLPRWDHFSSPEHMALQVFGRTSQLLENKEKFLTFFGGEHSISIGIIKAYNSHFKDLTVLQIDAHADLRPSYDGSTCNHACALHEASLETNLIQVGIRSMDESERQFMNLSQTYFMQDIESSEDWMSKSISNMTNDVYITLDLDAFDPSIIPTTGTPEPGGFNWYQMLKYLKKVFRERNVVGFDIVELAPIVGLSHPQFSVAKLYYKMLSYKFNQ